MKKSIRKMMAKKREKEILEEYKKPLSKKDIKWLKEHSDQFLPRHQRILDRTFIS